MPARNLAQGESLISIIIASGIFLILSSVAITLVSTSYKLLSYSRARTTARLIAQEKLEIIRNMPYESIGTVGGIPQGIIQQFESINRNGQTYIVYTAISYVDDPFDGTAPSDTLPVDYKRVRIDVSWEGIAPSSSVPVVFVSDIAPPGIESIEGGGTLSILVFDSQGQPVPQAQVSIVSTQTDPQINLTLTTNDNGIIVLPGSPACVECYNITVTKEGYSTDRTYTTAEVANPIKPPASVIENDLTEISFAIDELSTLTISTVSDRDSGFLPTGNTQFHLRGSKTIGTDVADFPVYKFDDLITTDSMGNVIIEDFEWDTYEIYFTEESDFSLSGSTPVNPFVLMPGENLETIATLSTHTSDSLLVVVHSGETLIDDAIVQLTLLEPLQVTTGLPTNPDFGQAFFPDLEHNRTYQLQVNKDGFEQFSTNITITGNETEKVLLISQ